MVDLLIETLETMGYPVMRQGSLGAEKYPQHFFTFWNDDTVGGGFYDNEETQTEWEYSVNFYSADPQEVNEKLLEAKKLLIKAGFVVTGKGYDVASDEPTHTGRGMSVFYKEKNQEE